jgi:uncharacterized protein (DUF885 family)
MTTTPHRSEVFAFASDLVDRDAELDPVFATGAGISGYDHLLTDFSPEHVAKSIDVTRSSLEGLARLEATDDVDRIAIAVMHERLTARLGLLESGEAVRVFGVLSSPLSEVRQAFELMATDSSDDLDVIVQRLGRVPAALASWRPTLEELAEKGQLPSRRHVVGVAEQATTYAEGTYENFVRRVAPSAEEQSAIMQAAVAADLACGELAAWLAQTLAPLAGEDDASGLDRYRAWSQYWNGAELDFDELYAWGYEDLRRLNARMWEIAREVVSDPTSLVDAADFFDNDPARRIEGTDELLRRLIGFTTKAVEELDGVHFDIDPRIRFCDARLAPEGSAAAPYYIGPSEDLSRPGTTWFPALGKTTF